MDRSRLEAIKEYFKTRPVLKAYWFGSHVRGEADNQSNIYILIDLDYSQRIGLGFVQLHIDLERILKAKVDLVSSNSLPIHFKPLVDSENEFIFAR